MSVLVTVAASLQQGLSEARQETECRGAKLAGIMEVKVEITSMRKEVTRLLSSVTKLREYRLAKDARTCHRDVQRYFLEERENISDWNLSS